MKKVAILPYADFEKLKYRAEHQPLQFPTEQHPPSHTPFENPVMYRHEPQLPLQQQLPFSLYDPKIVQMNNYEKELHRILNMDANIHEKRALYQTALQKLIDLKEMYQHISLTGSADENTSVPLTPNVKSEEDRFKHVLEQALPGKVKHDGLALYNILKDQISWDDSGQIIIDGETVPGSNIVDLISDLSRDRKKPAIRGWSEIKHELQLLHFPRTLIRNKQRLADLDDIPVTPKPETNPTGTSFASDRVKRTRVDTPVTGSVKIRKAPKSHSIPKSKWIKS